MCRAYRINTLKVIFLGAAGPQMRGIMEYLMRWDLDRVTKKKEEKRQRAAKCRADELLPLFKISIAFYRIILWQSILLILGKISNKGYHNDDDQTLRLPHSIEICNQAEIVAV